MRLAFVVPRYGDGIVGGAETLTRGLAEHLAAAGTPVEVLPHPTTGIPIILPRRDRGV